MADLDDLHIQVPYTLDQGGGRSTDQMLLDTFEREAFDQVHRLSFTTTESARKIDVGDFHGGSGGFFDM
jgi:hypothetical protein